MSDDGYAQDQEAIIDPHDPRKIVKPHLSGQEHDLDTYRHGEPGIQLRHEDAQVDKLEEVFVKHKPIDPEETFIFGIEKHTPEIDARYIKDLKQQTKERL